MIVRVEHDVARLQVTVHNLHRAQILETQDDLRGDVLGELVI